MKIKYCLVLLMLFPFNVFVLAAEDQGDNTENVQVKAIMKCEINYAPSGYYVSDINIQSGEVLYKTSPSACITKCNINDRCPKCINNIQEAGLKLTGSNCSLKTDDALQAGLKLVGYDNTRYLNSDYLASNVVCTYNFEGSISNIKKKISDCK